MKNLTAIEIRKGNVKTFKMIYDQYAAKLYYFTFKHCGSEYLSKEVVQLTFIKLWEKRANVSIDAQMSAQVFRTGKSIFIDLLRKESREQKKRIGSLVYQRQYQNGEQLILDKERWNLVSQKIESLPRVRQKVFKLSRIDCKSNKDIARELSLSVKTVENHITLALRELKGIPLIILLLVLCK
ncbi:sigma-70 family RNA polymerase sigma factor [Arachidicoccus terrestris]|uniref:sigma-70 family RNA polymerase sigma factor n=1 Tax=Arachidicoccus terrestris TaxID=2875539 RepID=UPI001CC42390|nr:sigma-70 family RNA polymerase sigma factor [Arachidicoccus terrestris]UAY56970.1 sigma-70 family RNA polymerase sigma factor [Arachidicoccus terrestris]